MNVIVARSLTFAAHLVGLVCLVYGLVSLCIYIADIYAVLPRKRPVATKHVIVTGGSSGIGLEVARLYMQKGFSVTIMARNKKKLEDASKELYKTDNKQGSIPSEARLQVLSCDVSSSEEEVSRVINQAVQNFGAVDILVNCAGTSMAAEFEESTGRDFTHMYQTNVLGSVYPTKAVVPSMKARGTGHIVFVSSQVAQAAIHGYSAYAASKWALRGLAEALQMELKPYRVAVSVAYPPDTRTPGYAEEMLTKPPITQILSATGTVLEAPEVARDIVRNTLTLYSEAQPAFTVSSGMDGFLLKQMHAGMTPTTNALEVTLQVFLASAFRLVAVFYLAFWGYLVRANIAKSASYAKEAEKKAL